VVFFGEFNDIDNIVVRENLSGCIPRVNDAQDAGRAGGASFTKSFLQLSDVQSSVVCFIQLVWDLVHS